MDQSLFVRCHAGPNEFLIAVSIGFTRFVYRSVLDEILFKPGIGGRERHGSGAVTVVNNVQRGQEETGAVPWTPLAVSINRANSHVHRGAVGQRKGRREVVGAGGAR